MCTNASKHVIRNSTTDVSGLPGRVACGSMNAAIIRFALFLATNGAILVLISIVFKVFVFKASKKFFKSHPPLEERIPALRLAKDT